MTLNIKAKNPESKEQKKNHYCKFTMYSYNLTQCPWIKHKLVKVKCSTFRLKGSLKGFKKFSKAGWQASPRKKAEFGKEV